MIDFNSNIQFNFFEYIEIKETSSIDSTIDFISTIQHGTLDFYTLRSYATATAVNIVVDFDDEQAFNFTLQTFIQILGTKPNGTEVTVTAPSSYVLNGFTYVFVNWRVDEIGQTSTNRIFTTTIDQQKTLRLRYIAFEFN